MDILTLGLGLGLRLGRVLGLQLGRQDVPGLKNTAANFLASGRSRQDVADPLRGSGGGAPSCQGQLGVCGKSPSARA